MSVQGRIRGEPQPCRTMSQPANQAISIHLPKRSSKPRRISKRGGRLAAGTALPLNPTDLAWPEEAPLEAPVPVPQGELPERRRPRSRQRRSPSRWPTWRTNRSPRSRSRKKRRRRKRLLTSHPRCGNAWLRRIVHGPVGRSGDCRLSRYGLHAPGIAQLRLGVHEKGVG